jgi:PPM family protein phosphatase
LTPAPVHASFSVDAHPQAQIMNIIAAGLSDVGHQREHNEDSFCILPEYDLFIVADGMGGHRAGDVASKMATHTIASFFQATSKEDATWPFHFDPHLSVEENRLITGIKVANRRIFEASTRIREVHGMGTTVVGALFSRERGRMYVAHVGDSRAYRVRKGEITQLTRDHSLVNDYLLVMPDMTQEQRDELPKNVITRALGMQDSVVVDLVPEQPATGDVYVLCSDGLSGMLTDDAIRDLVLATPNDMEAVAKALVERANANGGEDNVTVVVLQITD